MNNQNNLESDLKALLDAQSEKNFRSRQIKDTWSKYAIAGGGMLVILAVVLIFFYLLYVVLPMFASASMEVSDEQFKTVSISDKVVYSEIDEYGEMIASINQNGEVIFNSTLTGQEVTRLRLHPDINTLSAVATVSFELGQKVFVSGDKVLVAAIKYRLDYPDGKRKIIPYLDYPFGQALIDMPLVSGEKIKHVSAFIDEDTVGIAVASDSLMQATQFELQESMLDEAITLEPNNEQTYRFDEPIQNIYFGEDVRTLFVPFRGGYVDYLRFDDAGLKKVSQAQLDSAITSSNMLLGRFSLLVGTDDGSVNQLFLQRDQQNQLSLAKVRHFKHSDNAIVKIVPEQRRKGFVVLDSRHLLGVYYATSTRHLISWQFDSVADIAINSRSNTLLAFDKNQYQTYQIDNEHPEVSWSALWQSVWYEGYQEPDVIWQSSASNNDFEPKFSLTPLTFGTLKAAFYAMLFSIPLAITGAIFTAFFMTPSMRRMVKPAIEIMEALPTVILGFLAGLWLAPLVEANLAGVFSLLVLMPIAIILFGLLIAFLPQAFRNTISAGWQAALLIPVIIFTGWFCFGLGDFINMAFFDGDMRQWVSDEENGLGINFDQRNALVVGIAMGFAVIPTIFSITEDAVFSVPKHLVNGSLALGATPWQTVVRVVLPTASPGMFSAVMIGFGRAVGETIIVLMATGNTPIMDMNIFEGMRTLSANIAVEMPESEVGSTHFRILFLASFVLFIFTFIFNTFAEVIRQRLRTRYGSL